MNSYIVVNATALDQSGALSILKQFISTIPNDNYNWMFFTSDKIKIENNQQNIKIIHVSGVKNLLKRLWWDTFGLSYWLNRHRITPIACMSMQNTGFNVFNRKIPIFIYYHQSIPFYPLKWNPFYKSQRTLWFYKNIYPFFVKLFLTRETIIFVQLDYIKQGFVNSFKHKSNRVKVFSPSIKLPNIINPIDLPNHSLNLFYPASDFLYKNHKTIISAITEIKGNLILHLTIPGKSDSRILYHGSMPYSEVLSMYYSCDALLFPSYIETFGLPLLEAAMTGMPIIAADLPYAREVLDGYEGVQFVDYDNVNAWKKAIENLTKGRRYKPISISNRPGWLQLINTITSNI